MNSSNWTMARATSFVGIVIAIVLSLLLLWFAMEIAFLTFAGILFAVFLERLTKWVSQKTKLGHGWALSLVLLTMLLVSGGVAVPLLPEISGQIDELSETIPKAMGDLKKKVEGSKWMSKSMDSAMNKGDGGKEAVKVAGGILSASAALIGGAVYILFLGVFLAADPALYVRGFVGLFPKDKRKKTAQLMEAFGDTLWAFLYTRFLTMAILGVLTMIGLMLLKVPMALTLGLLAGTLLFVPYVGAIASAVPAILVALMQDSKLAVYVLILYVVTHLIEGYILTPLLQKKAMEMPPALLLGFQVLMEAIGGIPGMALSTPLLAVVMVAVQKLYKEDVLEDKS